MGGEHNWIKEMFGIIEWLEIIDYYLFFWDEEMKKLLMSAIRTYGLDQLQIFDKTLIGYSTLFLAGDEWCFVPDWVSQAKSPICIFIVFELILWIE